MKDKIGIIVTFNISKAGGAPRVVVDLINALKKMGKEVYLLNPFKLNFKDIEKFYGGVKIDKIFCPRSIKSFFCRGGSLPRRLLKKEFKKFAKEVDIIIDTDGGIFHKYLPKNFNNSRYIIWRISCVIPESERPWIKRGLKSKIKMKLHFILGSKKIIPSKNHKIYAIDEWTAKELNYLDLKAEKLNLYPEIKIENFLNKMKKKNQIIIFGRIAPNKNIEEGLKIFARVQEGYKNYNLIILGGLTLESQDYIQKLMHLIKGLHLEQKVKIIGDPSFEKLVDIVTQSKILLESQKEVSLTMTSIEAMAAGCQILAYKKGGTYQDILENGKYGEGFLTIDEGAQKLEKIICDLEKGKGNIESIKRAKDFSQENFIKRLKQILKENGL